MIYNIHFLKKTNILYFTKDYRSFVFELIDSKKQYN